MWRTGLVAPQHVGSSRTRAQTHVPCIGRLILNHFATREVPTQVAFNSMCINGLHKNLSLLVKRTCMEWETVFTPDLVNLANKLAHIIEGDSRKKTYKNKPKTIKKMTIGTYISITLFGASLVAQWLRIRLPMQGTRVRALVQEDPTCRGATKPVRHNH